MATSEPSRRATTLDRAEWHAEEAERMLRSRYLTSWVRGQLHATLAVYYATRQSREE
jgi:hypothetical protein